MTFLAKWRLLLLVAPVALLAAYLLVQRLRARTTVRFTNVDLLASVAPRRPGWQRHVAPALLLLSIVGMVAAFAEPAKVVRTPRQRAVVMLVIDVSGSMTATDVTPTRLEAAQSAARSFVAGLPKGVQLGLVSFSQTASVQVSPTTDRSTIDAAIDDLQAGGGTATADAMELALSAIKTAPVAANGKKVPAAIVLMSDGTPTIASPDTTPLAAVQQASADAKAAGVRVSTIAFGTPNGTVNVRGEQIPVPSDPATMADIAKTTGGDTFTARTAGQLRSVYSRIGRAVGFDVHRSDITVWFTGAALILVVAAAAAALVWTQRIP